MCFHGVAAERTCQNHGLLLHLYVCFPEWKSVCRECYLQELSIDRGHVAFPFG